MDQDNPAWTELASRRLDDPAYLLAYARWEKLWRGEKAAFVVKGRVRVRLLVGMGAKGVTQAGLRLSHTYGTPVIPGSAVKGVVRAYIEQDDKELARLLFGDTDGQGLVTMEDAWWAPEPRPPLVLDVVTSHHPRYYTGSEPPADFDNPNPFQFLSVRGSFLFAGRFEGTDTDGKWAGYLKGVLREALEKIGIGGKTASGYGRFSFVE
jgi:CRISPR-associated protein Cmr6